MYTSVRRQYPDLSYFDVSTDYIKAWVENEVQNVSRRVVSNELVINAKTSIFMIFSYRKKTWFASLEIREWADY